MGLTRREFLKTCGGAVAGVSLSQSLIPEIVWGLEKAVQGKPPVLWIQGAGCTGCSVSLLNTVHPNIAEVLIKIIDVRYHPTIMAAAGEMAIDALEETAKETKGKLCWWWKGPSLRYLEADIVWSVRRGGKKSPCWSGPLN